ncbi:MAG: hypothetical protein IRY99_16200 [Isosphaeraceae bacterium]|nr:hypothetical protein [Isosphaeraceae bacterium]
MDDLRRRAEAFLTRRHPSKERHVLDIMAAEFIGRYLEDDPWGDDETLRRFFYLCLCSAEGDAKNVPTEEARDYYREQMEILRDVYRTVYRAEPDA